MNGAKHEHRIGKYLVRTEWRGRTLLYEILASGGRDLVAVGIDSLSSDENTALAAITDRLFGKDKQRSAA